MHFISGNSMGKENMDNHIITVMDSKISVHKVFVYLAFIFGLILVAIIPPFQSPDEDSHFKKALVLSEGQLFPTVRNGKEGVWLAPEDVEYIKNKSEAIRGDLSKKVSYLEMHLDEKLPWTRSEKEFYMFSTVKTNPIAHIIPAIGIFIGKGVAFFALKGEPSVTFLLYFARMFSLFFYIAITAYSIYIIPCMKKTMCMIALMPMTLYLAAATSYDSLLICLSFLLVAKVLRLVYTQTRVSEISLRDCIIFSIIAYIFLVIKVVYIPLFAVFLLLPCDLKDEKKEIAKKVGLILGGVFAVYFLYKIPESIFVRGVINVESNAGEQLSFVLQHPINYLEILFGTIINFRDYYVNTFIGCLGLLDTNFISAIAYLYLSFLICLGIMEISLSKINIKLLYRVIIGLGIVASVFGIFLAMYLMWTSKLEGLGVGASEISGVQGRYFIPLALSTFLIFANNRLCKNEKVEKFFMIIIDNSVMVALAMLCLTVLFLLLRFWC